MITQRLLAKHYLFAGTAEKTGIFLHIVCFGKNAHNSHLKRSVCLFVFLSLFFFLSEPWVGRTTKETFGTVWWLALLEFSHFKENHSLSLRTGMEGKQPAPWLSAGKAVWDRAGDAPPPTAGQLRLRLRQVGRQASRADASAGPSSQIAGDQHFPH